MKRNSQILALLLAVILLLGTIPAASAESVKADSLTAEEYYALRASAEGAWDDGLWNSIIKRKINKAESLDAVGKILEDQNNDVVYKGLGKSVDKNFYPVLSDAERTEVDAKIAGLYADEIAKSGTLKDAYEAQNQRDGVANLLGNNAAENMDAQLTADQTAAIDNKLNELVAAFVSELVEAKNQDEFAKMLEFMTDDQKLDFLNRLTDELYNQIQDFVENYLWPGQEFTIAEERSFTGGLRVNGELISGNALRDYLFSLEGRAFKVAVNQMNINQAGSLEARVSDDQAAQIVIAMCHAGFPVSEPSISVQSSAPAKASRAAAHDATAGSQPVWPNEGSIKLDKEAKAVVGKDNLWEVTLGIKGKNYKTTSDVVLVIDNSNSMYDDDRMTQTKKAANAFVDALLEEGSTTRVALVVYNEEIYKQTGFYGAAGKDSLKSEIASIKQDKEKGGTNQQAGIHAAQQLLSSAASTGNLKNIVILSDGEPTFSYPFVGGSAAIDCGQFFGHWFSDDPQVSSWPVVPVPDYETVIGSGSYFAINGNIRWNCTCKHGRTTDKLYGSFYYDSNGNFVCSNGEGSANNGIATIWEANQAKAAGTTIYSIALQADTNGEKTLKACATDGKGYFAIASNDNVQDKLTEAFDKVAGSIAIAAKNGTVADTMGEKVQLSFTDTAPRITNDVDAYGKGEADVYISQGSATYDSANRTINWTVGNVSEGDNPTMKYKVKVKEGVKPATGEVLDTNKEAKFNYKNYQGEDTEQLFPVPKVTVGGGTILMHYYLVNEKGEPINESGVVVESPSLAKQVQKETYFANETGSTGLSYNTPYTVPKGDIADYDYYGSYILNGGVLENGDSASVTLTASNSNQHVWFAYKEKPKSADLTIVKEGCDKALDPGQTFVFMITGADGFSMEVVVHEDGRVTIKDLPAGTYTVTENMNWSWRYETADSQNVTIAGEDETLKFKNTRTKKQWLDGNASCDNRWGQSQDSSN